jgi:hypothetical protein
LSKNVKIKIYRTVILLVVLYGCETLILKEERGLKGFEIRVPRKILGLRGTREQRSGENCIMRS